MRYIRQILDGERGLDTGAGEQRRPEKAARDGGRTRNRLPAEKLCGSWPCGAIK